MARDTGTDPSRSHGWMERCEFRPAEGGMLTSANGRVGLGAVLMAECSATGRFLMARKSFRAGYEMNHRLTFPGGMVRASDAAASLCDMITTSLEHRALVEARLSLNDVPSLAALDQLPPMVEYEHPETAGGDGSTYDTRWRDLDSIWPEVSYANGISLAQLVWGRLTPTERQHVQAVGSRSAAGH